MLDGGGQHLVERKSADRARQRTAIERAVGDLRRGGGVVLSDGRRESAVVVVAAEAVGAADRTIARAENMPFCIIPRALAAALVLPAFDAGAVAIPCRSPGGREVDAGFVRAVAGIDGGAVPMQGRNAAAADALQRAALELIRLARLLPVAVAARISGCADEFATRHDLLTVQVAWIEDYATLAADEEVALVTHAPVPLEGAEQAEVFAFRPRDGGREQLAIVIGAPAPDRPILVRIHSECFTGDLLGSLRCDCGDQLRGAIREIAAHGAGVLLYLAQEGRGIGLVNKLRAYRLQDEGFDTIDANERLGFEADARAYRPAATMLRALGVTRVRLLTNNPAKVEGLSACGIEVAERVPHAFPANGHNNRYLSTKAARAGHLL